MNSSFPDFVRIVTLSAILVLMLGCGQAVVSKPTSSAGTEAASSPDPPPEPSSEPAPPETASAEASHSEAEGAPATDSACAGGAVKDDGSVETGYGYVPSATMGKYVQAFESSEVGGTALNEVCVCWLRSRADSDLDYEVVFYTDKAGRPAAEPYATLTATATEVPKGVPEAGRFFSVDASDVTLPEGRSFIGVRWDPSDSKFFFVCADQSRTSPWVDVFSAEDRAPAWRSVAEARDPIFKPHRSILIRARATP